MRSPSLRARPCPGLKAGTYVLICVASCLMMPRGASAQVSKGTPEARAEFDRGQEAAKQKQNDVALAAFRKAIEIDPAFLDAHSRFVSLISAKYEEDSVVRPFITNNKYGFIPLRGNIEWASKTYNVLGTPTNFLLDRQGRVLFKPRVYDADTERTLELEIEALLQNG